MNVIQQLEKEQQKKKVPALRAGDTVRVHAKVVEGTRERIQVFEGTVIRVTGGGLRQNFTVRRVTHGVGVERTFMIHSPRIDKIDVLRHGDVRQRPQKRYDDTKLILAEMLDSGLDSDRGREANRRMNRMHARYSIKNEDYLYVLSTIVLEPIRWNRRWGWRLYTDRELEASLEYMRHLASRMRIRDVPASLEELERWSRGYEATRLRHTESNRRVADYTLNLYLSWFPRALLPLVRQAIFAVFDDALLDAFSYQHPPRWLRGMLDLAMRVRAHAVRLLPRRRTPRLISQSRTRTYPGGHALTDLGVPGAEPPMEGRLSV